MATTYSAHGFKPTSTSISGTNASSVTVDLDNTTGITYIVGTLSAATETNNFQHKFQFFDSSSDSIRMRAVTTTNGTSNRFSSTNWSGTWSLNYWNIGALNSDSSVTGERGNFFMIIDNHLNTSSPYIAPHALAFTAYRANNGAIQIADFRGVMTQAKNIAKVQFFPSSGDWNAYRLRVYNIFEA